MYVCDVIVSFVIDRLKTCINMFVSSPDICTVHAILSRTRAARTCMCRLEQRLLPDIARRCFKTVLSPAQALLTNRLPGAPPEISPETSVKEAVSLHFVRRAIRGTGVGGISVEVGDKSVSLCCATQTTNTAGH